MTLIEWPEDEPIPRSVRVQIGRMLGATIDFIPAGVDFKERVAIGSRKAAMLQRQKRYYASRACEARHPYGMPSPYRWE